MAYLHVDIGVPVVSFARTITRVNVQPDAPVIDWSGQLWPRSQPLAGA